MPLSPEQREKISELAEKLGVEEKTLLTMAEELQRETSDEVASPAARDDRGPAEIAESSEPPKIFQYHLPFLTVAEIRASIGMTGAVPDAGMLAGEWLARHGGTLAGGSK